MIIQCGETVFELQPDIIVNNRNLLPGDFSTPEQEIVPAKGEHDWETCMTMNESWGYQAADDNWKTPKTSLRNLITCARDGGNFLYNLGPRADASIPEESVRVLNAVGAWMDKNGGTIYGAERCEVRNSLFANFTRKGHTLYIHVHFWPGETVSIGGLRTRVKSAKLLASGKPVNFKQDQFRVQFTGLPASPPDHPITVIAAECESEPVQDMASIRKKSGTTRRSYLTMLGASATAAASVTALSCKKEETKPAQPAEKAAEAPPADHERRIQWWREAKFGMFVHWGLYSVLGRCR